LQHMNINPVAKIISQVFHKLSITPNDLLLSRILDVENIIVKHTLIREELEKINLWKTVYEQIQYTQLDERLIEFILELWRTPEYTMQSPSINKSTWEYDVLDPIVKFITYDLEEDIFIRW
ncbi:3685_t:CDS:2, partial [Gigaspora margarita]